MSNDAIGDVTLVVAGSKAEIDGADVPDEVKEKMRKRLDDGTSAAFVYSGGNKYILMLSNNIEPVTTEAVVTHEIGHNAAYELGLTTEDMLPCLYYVAEHEPEIMKEIEEAYEEQPENWAEEATMKFLRKIVQEHGLNKVLNATFASESENGKKTFEVISQIVNYIKNGKEDSANRGRSYQSSEVDNQRRHSGDEEKHRIEGGGTPDFERLERSARASAAVDSPAMVRRVRRHQKLQSEFPLHQQRKSVASFRCFCFHQFQKLLQSGFCLCM